MHKKLIAEALGTFTLTLAVIASIHSGAATIPTPAVAGLVVALFVYTVGWISGAHFNPAVTIGLWVGKHIDQKEAIAYIATQLAAALAALAISTVLIGEQNFSMAPESLQIFLAELIGATILTFGIAAVVHNKVSSTLSGIVIGWSLLIGIILASALGSAGILNPAVALALGSLNLSYALGAIAGGIIGVQLYKQLTK